MKPIVIPLLAVALSCFGIATKPMSTALSLSSSPERSVGEQWRTLLSCAETRSSECKELIEAKARRSSSNDLSRLLATALLEEWDFERDNPKITRARRIWLPMLELDEARSLLPAEFEHTTIVLTGVVTPLGTVESVVVLRSSKYEKLNRQVSEDFSRALYRPAWGSDGFVSQRVEYVYRLEPRE
jgi:hypothetical protein